MQENPGDLSWDRLGKLGELTVYDSTSLTDEGRGYRPHRRRRVVLPIRLPLPKKVIDACPNMKMIGMLATGYNVVDYVYARKRAFPSPTCPPTVPPPSVVLHRPAAGDAPPHRPPWRLRPCRQLGQL